MKSNNNGQQFENESGCEKMGVKNLQATWVDGGVGDGGCDEANTKINNNFIALCSVRWTYLQRERVEQRA